MIHHKNVNIPFIIQVVEDLQEHHRLAIPQEVASKKDVAADILFIFTDKKIIKFIRSDKTVKEVRGRWCCVCK